MKFGTTYSVLSEARIYPDRDGLNSVQLAHDVDDQQVLCISGTFTANELRNLACCLEGTKNIMDEFDVEHIS